jgi:feruloyl esterase
VFKDRKPGMNMKANESVMRKKSWVSLIRVTTTVIVLAVLSSPGPAAAQAQAPGATTDAKDLLSCAAVRNIELLKVRVTSADTIGVQRQWSPGGRARAFDVQQPFCRVQGVIETEMGFELWLPAKARWNGKFLGAGVGGDAGTFNYADLPRGLLRGYAAGSTDTGHKITDPNWMLGDPMRLANFELRSNHLLAVTSKRIITQYYDSPVRYAYFIGCSGGGRQGLKEMQRFPDDYNGIIAGAPGPKTPEMTARRMWELKLRDAQNGLMSPGDWKLISEEAIKSCDAADGVMDGVAEDPRNCHFDVKTLQCKDGQTKGCLSAAQVTFAKGFYDPLKDDSGHAIDDGLLPGVLVDSGRSRLAPATFGQAIRHQADWKGDDFDVTRDLAAIDKVMPELRADDPDLAPFNARKGKAILYQGWMDPAVAAMMTLGYYQDVEKKMGSEKKTEDFIRLFMVPGMLHCGGGPGTDQFGGSGNDAPVPDADHDLLSALEIWVEHNQPPGPVIASRMVEGKVVRTRPLCAYPAFARYNGTGDTDDASNFQCVRK